jgi:hypothetical protein
VEALTGGGGEVGRSEFDRQRKNTAEGFFKSRQHSSMDSAPRTGGHPRFGVTEFVAQ